ncbi:Asp-tRNA(Asn)/Glu-tRNA(Gln) amidotransferase GatCAB subunit B, partial [bacterium]|nr:Asp-tRNA(Asn)/Glu-tRNA(Gln) amidotransferase GatCAB subunit B [bacterium]
NLAIDSIKLSPANFLQLLRMIQQQIISATAAKEILEEMVISGNSPENVMIRLGLKQESDRDQLEKLAKDILDDFTKEVYRYKAGKSNVLGVFIGEGMKRSNGKINPSLFREIIISMLDEG